MTAAVVVLALLVPLAAVLISSGGDNGGVAATGGGVQKVAVELSELSVKPASIQVPAGAELVLTVKNAGTMPHDLRLEGGGTGTRLLDPGETEEVSLGKISSST